MTLWRIAWIALGCCAVLWLAWLYIRPHFDTRPEQDACSFGPVTNERYRELLAEARHRQSSGRWPRLSGDGLDMNANLQFRLDDLMDGMDSIYERIAAMHAVMRALGANYSSTSPDFPDAFESARRRSRWVDFGSVGFVYVLDVHSVGGFAPILRYARINVSYIADKTQIFSWNNFLNDTFAATISYPFTIYGRTSFFFIRNYISYAQYNVSCPAIPGSKWVSDYNKWLSILKNDRNDR